MQDQNNKPVLFLLDGHALVYRAHYAFISRPLINSKGMNTSAISGFVRTLWDIITNQKPSHIAVAFDPSTPTFRHEYYPEYKAQREAQPEDITFAIPWIKKILKAMHIPIVEVDGFEADDVIGTLSKQAEKEGFAVYMVTPDKDYGQLVSENIFMYKPSRQGNGIEILGVQEILENWQIARVDQVIEMLGLTGDSVDNIPGVPGVGPKTAVELLKTYDNIENIIANADHLKGKLSEKIRDNADKATMSKYLATINIEVPINFDAHDYQIDPMDKEALIEIFKELEFRTLAEQVLGMSAPNTNKQTVIQGDLFSTITHQSDTSAPVATPSSNNGGYVLGKQNIGNTTHDYKLVQTPDEKQGLISRLKNAQMICFDTETTGLDAHYDDIVGVAFSIEKGSAYYMPLPADRTLAVEYLKDFEEIFSDITKIFIGQNIKFDATLLKWYGLDVKGRLFDTMIAHYLCEPDQRHKLDILAENYLDYKMVPIEDLIGKGKNQLNMKDISLDKVKEYAGEDADITFQLYDIMNQKLKENDLTELYWKIEAPLIRILRDMECEGVRLNAEFLHSYSKDLEKLINDTEKQIYELAGVRFNIASPKQVGEVLFEKLKIPYRWKKTGQGQYSTDVEKLTELENEYDIIKKILEHRKYSKLKSTYVDALPEMINQRTGRIHSNFNQARAATGRLSSENPNMQNIPIRDEAGREIRKAFIPRDENHIILAADYSQIELRLIAEISKDEVMLEAFHSGNDFHRATAAKVYNVALEDVTSEQRRNAKTVNFSIIYGAGSTNLSRQLNISRTEAKELIDNYFAQFQGLKKYMEDTVDFARKNGYVSTLLGRKRVLRDINSRNSLASSNSERMAINTPIQGSSADMIKLAMISIHEEFIKNDFKSRMILQVHDELVFDVYKPELETIKPIISEKMKNAIPGLSVPILVEMGTGDNWLEAH
jgi:DNA polymerase I